MVSPIITKVTTFVKFFWYDLFMLGCIICIAIISYNLGTIRALKQKPVVFSDEAQMYTAGVDPRAETADLAGATAPKDPRVVVSKSSTSKKYHYSWCASGKRITQANQVWFENEAAAQKAGYTLAGNCQ